MSAILARPPLRERGPAPALTLAACLAAGCNHSECRRADEAHARLTPPVPAAGTARRLQALVWMRHPVAALAARLGEDELALCSVLHGYVTEVSPSLAAAATGLYDDLWDVPGPSDHAAEFAARHGWAPPLAWDEPGDVCIGHSEPGDCPGHDIEDPAAAPVPGWQRRKLTAAERLTDIAEVLPTLATRQEVAWRMGVTRGYADTLASRMSRAAGGAS
jgi:hypothetical protein